MNLVKSESYEEFRSVRGLNTRPFLMIDHEKKIYKVSTTIVDKMKTNKGIGGLKFNNSKLLLHNNCTILKIK